MKAEVIFENGIPVSLELTAEEAYEEEFVKQLWLGIKPAELEVKMVGSKIRFKPMYLPNGKEMEVESNK